MPKVNGEFGISIYVPTVDQHGKIYASGICSAVANGDTSWYIPKSNVTDGSIHPTNTVTISFGNDKYHSTLTKSEAAYIWKRTA